MLPLEVDPQLAQPASEIRLLLPEDLHGLLREPLERRVRLGNEGAGADCEAETAGPLPAGDPGGLAGDTDDLVHVRLRLGGQADHEVELERLPAGPSRLLDGGQDFLLVEPDLVDHSPEAIRARLGSDSETSLSHLRNLGGQILVPIQGLHA